MKVSYFNYYFDDEVFDIFDKETIKYALFKNCPNPNVNKEEIKCFITMLLFTSNHSLLRKRNFWSSQPDKHVEFHSNTMRWNRFELIMRFLHCVDNNKVNETDQMWK